MRQALEDDLSNLLDPWSPYAPDFEDGEVGSSMTRTIQLIERSLEMDLAADASQSLPLGEFSGQTDHLSAQD